MNEVLKDRLKTVPNKPGCYLMRDSCGVTQVRLEVLKRAAVGTDEEIVAETDEAVRRTEEDNE